MNATTLISFFERDLNKLIAELELYKNEENIWHVEKNISNSAGHLTLHLIGNLNTFVGKEIGKTDYIRNRELEFSQNPIPRKELIKNINKVLEVIKTSLINVTQEELQQEYPFLKFLDKPDTEYVLVHLATHLAYHLGQINYHRRLIEE